MNRDDILKKLKSIEDNAHRLLDDAMALKEELSGGSDSSNSQVLTLSQKDQIIARRRKHAFK